MVQPWIKLEDNAIIIAVMAYLTIDSIHSYYTIQGEGDPVILLHGWGQNTTMMQFIQDHLSSRYQVINLDFPGFGQSEEPKRVYGVDDYAQWLRSLLQQLNITIPPILIGHSFGCRVALVYASKWPVKKMVLTGAAGIREKQSLTTQAKVKLYKLGKKVAPKLAAEYAKKVGSSDYQQTSGVMRGTFVKVVNQDLKPLLPSINVETLLVFGDQDDQTPLWMGQMMEKLMPNAGLAIFKGQGHYAYFIEGARFLRVLDAFM